MLTSSFWYIVTSGVGLAHLLPAIFVITAQVFHKVITSGLPRLQPLYDSLLTILVNGELGSGGRGVCAVMTPLVCSLSVSEVTLNGHLLSSDASAGGTVLSCCSLRWLYVPFLPPVLLLSFLANKSFSTTWFLFAKPTNHFLVFYLLEIFNNIVQYQFDGEVLSCQLHHLL